MKFNFKHTLAFGTALLTGLLFGNIAAGVAKNENFSFPIYEIEAPDGSYLIAASTQLDNLLYNFTFRYNNTVRYYKIPSPDHYAAYTLAWLEFSNIAQVSTISPPIYSPSAGFIYTARLKGVGTTNLREYGSSPQTEPTIDILNHYTRTLNGQTFDQVREVKFPYTKPLFCPVSTTSC
ncbi:hypothetical protein [[Limnothrix rosea] IAM M-220]|uniref:hypothetical protein n=1 Tax=[Limnothrix rosea] IAM M-220 TaxID=454133 RepID=UPI00096A0085|nr:hypothetical protein [[Limnothrix rosea] IAM M-220]OKH20026.1 hypothetical protein NIES208_00710 [[Limnothrix rosea] IAM M-220]